MRHYFSALNLALIPLLWAQVAHAQDTDVSAITATVDQSSSDAGAIAAARQQGDAGELLAAAGILERRLLASPDSNDVRIWYATMLCRLDDPQGARGELKLLDRQKFSEDAWSAMTTACGPQSRPVAAANGSKGGISGSIAAGIAYESDSYGPLTLQTITAATPQIKADGLSVVASARIDGKTQSYFTGGGIYGGVNASIRQSISGPSQKYELVDVHLGFGRQSGSADYSLGAVVRQLGIYGHQYAWEYGTQAALGFAHTKASRLVLLGEAVYQQYGTIGPGTLADGWRYDLGLSYEQNLSRDAFFSLGIAVEKHDARSPENGYFGGRITAFYQGPLGDKGAYFNLLGTVRYTDYTDNAPLQDRRDTGYYARAAYGHPLGSDRLFLEGAVSFTGRTIATSATAASTVLSNFSGLSSFGAELRLVWKFGN